MCENDNQSGLIVPKSDITKQKPLQTWQNSFLKMLPTDNISVETMSRINGNALSTVVQTIGNFGSAVVRGEDSVPLQSSLILMVGGSKKMSDILLDKQREITNMLKKKDVSLLDLWLIVLADEVKIYHYQNKQRGFMFTRCLKPVDSIIEVMSYAYYPIKEAEKLCDKEMISFETILQEFSDDRAVVSDDLLKIGSSFSDLGYKILLFSDKDMSVKENYASCYELMTFCNKKSRRINSSRPKAGLFLIQMQQFWDFLSNAGYKYHVSVLGDW